MDNTAGYVASARHGSVGVIEFFHPQGNSLPRHLLDKLTHEISHAGLDKEMKVIVLKSAGDRAFCGGASFDELAGLTTSAEGKFFFEGFSHVIQAMKKCPKFIVVRVQGKCIGGAVGIAAAADYTIAAAAAEIRLSELAMGFGPFVIGPAVERKIGLSAFSQLAIDAGSWRSAAWAKSHGLFAEVHETIEGLDESVDRLAAQLSHYNPEAMHEIKQILWEGTSHWEHLFDQRTSVSGKLAVGSHAKAAIAQFKQKKK